MGHRSRHGGAWRTTVQPSIRHGGSWRAASAAWIRKNGVWLKWWPDLPDRGGPYLYGNIPSLNYIGRFDGSSWASVGGGLANQVNNAALTDAGNIICVTGPAFSGAAKRWNGSSWATVGTGWAIHSAKTASDGTRMFYAQDNGVAAADSWIYEAPISGSASVVVTVSDTTPFGYSYFRALAASQLNDPDFLLYSEGNWNSPLIPPMYSTPFSNGSGSFGTRFIARQLDGRVWYADATAGIYYETAINTWSGSIPSSVSGGNINCVCAIPGKVWAGGDFTSINGVSCSGLAEWDGSAWTAVGTPGYVVGMAYHQGKLWVLVGSTITSRSVYTWDGTTWSLQSSWSGSSVYGIM